MIPAPIQLTLSGYTLRGARLRDRSVTFECRWGSECERGCAKLRAASRRTAHHDGRRGRSQEDVRVTGSVCFVLVRGDATRWYEHGAPRLAKDRFGGASQREAEHRPPAA